MYLFKAILLIQPSKSLEKKHSSLVLHNLVLAYLSSASQVAQWVKNPPAMQETEEMWVQFLGQEDPLEEDTATHASSYLENPMDKRSLTSYSRRVSKSQMLLRRLGTHTLLFISFLGMHPGIIHELCSYPKEHFLISKVYSFSCTSLPCTKLSAAKILLYCKFSQISDFFFF